MTGAAADRLFAFARTGGSGAAITLVPRLARPLLIPGDGIQLDAGALRDSAIRLPEPLAGREWRSLFDSEAGFGGGSIAAPMALARWPVALLVAA